MKNQNFYIIFGYVTCAFARMEAELRVLLSGLAFGDNAVIAAAFLDSSQLSENTRTLRTLAREFCEYEKDFLEIAKGIERLRETRNLFIHGLWKSGTFGDKDGVAVVQDLNIKYSRTSTMRQWVRGESTAVSAADFKARLTEINAVVSKIEKLCAKLKKREQMSFEHFAIISAGDPVRMNIGDDGSLVPVN